MKGKSKNLSILLVIMAIVVLLGVSCMVLNWIGSAFTPGTKAYKVMSETFPGQQKGPTKKNKDWSAKSGARHLVEKNLKAPSTAKWLGEEIVDQQDSCYLVCVEVDAQNSFGALIRSCYLVYLIVGVSDGKSVGLPLDIIESGYPPSPSDLKKMKKRNGWPGYSGAKRGRE